MIYLSWATLLEGSSDGDYFHVLIPRIIEDIVALYGVRAVTVPSVPAIRLGQRGRDISNVAVELCESKDAFEIAFVHADMGGRSQEASVARRTFAYCDEAHSLCNFPIDRCVHITPRHEMEAWALTDPAAILGALGYRGPSASLSLPRDGREAERLQDPKAILREIVVTVRGRKRHGRAEIPFAAIAQRQSLEALRSAPTFAKFESDLRAALVSLGCVSA